MKAELSVCGICPVPCTLVKKACELSARKNVTQYMGAYTHVPTDTVTLCMTHLHVRGDFGRKVIEGLEALGIPLRAYSAQLFDCAEVTIRLCISA